MNKVHKSQLVSFVDFLGDVLGDNIEIILHIIDKDESYIAAIKNGYISGRTENSPLTKLALDFIKDEVYKEKQAVTNYIGITKDNKQVQASTFFMKNEDNELYAMLCFNIDVTRYTELAKKIYELGNIQNESITLDAPIVDRKYPASSENIEFVEYFSESLSDYFNNIVTENQIDLNSPLRPDDKIEIVRQLHAKGYFEIKGAVAQVAELLHVSEPSVYRYLNQIE